MAYLSECSTRTSTYPVVDEYPFSPCVLQSWGRERTKEGKDISRHLYLINRVAPIKGRSKVEKTEKTRMQCAVLKTRFLSSTHGVYIFTY